MKLDNGDHGRPGQDEHIPYYGQYIDLVPNGDIVEIMVRQIDATQEYFAGFSSEEAVWRLRPEEWNAIEVVGHLGDTERVIMHRALGIARGDETPWASFEPDLYVANGGFGARSLADMLTEWSVVRSATLTLLRGLDDAAWARRMPESFSGRSVRALAYMVAGHVTHHVVALRAERAEHGPKI